MGVDRGEGTSDWDCLWYWSTGHFSRPINHLGLVCFVSFSRVLGFISPCFEIKHAHPAHTQKESFLWQMHINTRKPVTTTHTHVCVHTSTLSYMFIWCHLSTMVCPSALEMALLVGNISPATTQTEGRLWKLWVSSDQIPAKVVKMFLAQFHIQLLVEALAEYAVYSM